MRRTGEEVVTAVTGVRFPADRRAEICGGDCCVARFRNYWHIGDGTFVCLDCGMENRKPQQEPPKPTAWSITKLPRDRYGLAPWKRPTSARRSRRRPRISTSHEADGRAAAMTMGDRYCFSSFFSPGGDWDSSISPFPKRRPRSRIFLASVSSLRYPIWPLRGPPSGLACSATCCCNTCSRLYGSLSSRRMAENRRS